MFRVALFKENLDKMPVMPEIPKDGSVPFLFSGSRNPGKRILHVVFRHNKIDKDIFATYPLKSVDTAWRELASGNGYVADLGDNEDGNITIRKVYQAYYDSTELQNFLQPIFVFEGDKDFVAYVSAVDPKWID
jgi:hypothetical protein